MVWLLLWLASSLHPQAFPDEVSQAAQVIGADRDTANGDDIRTLPDEQGKTGEEVARSMGETWAQLLRGGFLSVGA